MILTVRIPREDYEEIEGHPGGVSRAFRRGTGSYLEHPRVIKLMMNGSPEERLDDVLLMLAQTRASYGVLRTWEASESPKYRANREEYVALANEYEKLDREVVPDLKKEVRALRREVVELEARLEAGGGDPGEIEPPFPGGVSRPSSLPPDEKPERSPLRKLWRRLTGPVRGRT